MNYQFTRFSPSDFEEMIQSLVQNLLGNKAIIYGKGPDGGRELTYNGKAPFPNQTEMWEGFWVIQAKFKDQIRTAEDDYLWLKSQFEKEMLKFESGNLKKPDNYLLFTNAVLSSVNQKGGRDKIENLKEKYKGIIPNISIIAYNELCAFIDNNRDVAISYGVLVNPGDIFGEVANITLNSNIILSNTNSLLNTFGLQKINSESNKVAAKSFLDNQRRVKESKIKEIIINKRDYKILNDVEYNTCKEQFHKIEENPFIIQCPFNSQFVAQIKGCLNEKGITFITGPIQFGKTFILKFIKNDFKEYRFIKELNGDDPYIKTRKIRSKNELYFFWYKEISKHILEESNKKIDQLDIVTRGQMEVYKEFMRLFNSKRLSEEGMLKAFVRILAVFKEKLDFKKDIIISFHLDDIHAYISESIFQELRKDMMDLLYFNEEKLSVKVIITSRYLPVISSNNNVVNFLPFLTLPTIEKLADILGDEMTENGKKIFSNLILQKTDGYPWFVMRFFKIYLNHRVAYEKSSPVELALKIFDTKIYWTKDSVFNNNINSKFSNELIRLIEKSDPKMKSEFKKFISNDNPTSIELNDGWYSTNDFLIRQSGFFKINPDADAFENNGCYLLRKHIKEMIDPLLQ